MLLEPHWGMFFDFHTMPGCPEVGAEFDCDALAEHLAECGIDFIVFPARCNLGMAYYNTKTGIRHPSLQYDLLGRLMEACGRRNIRVSVYINLGLSHQEGAEHRDWLTIPPDGGMYQPDRLNNFFRRMCYNSPYGEHVISMVEELLQGYPVAGFFFDCVLPNPCIGHECVQEMRAKGYDCTKKEDIVRFAKESRTRFARRISEKIKAHDPDLLIYYNGIPFDEQKTEGTYLEYEALGRSCYEGLPATAHYARNLGKPVLNMIGRFHNSWADFGGIRTTDSLEYDLALGFSNAMRCTVGDHFHPRGDILEPVFDLVRETYRKFRVFDRYLEHASAVTEIAVLVPPMTFDYSVADSAPLLFSLYGTARMLDELHQQYDILTTDMAFDGYRMLILPDQVRLDEDTALRIREFLRRGGKVFSSWKSGLREKEDVFALPEEWNAVYLGDSPHDPAYLRVDPQFCPEFPRMASTLYRKGASLQATGDGIVAGTIIRPYYNVGWDGEHGVVYNPPDRETGEAGLVKSDSVMVFSHPLFRTYYECSQPQFRELFRTVLAELLPEPLIQASGLPPYGRCTMTRQADGRRMIHLMNYHPESPSPNVVLVVPPEELRDMALSIRTDGSVPQKIYFGDTGREIPFQVENGRIHLRVDSFRGYTILVME